MSANLPKHPQANKSSNFLKWVLFIGVILALPIYLLNCWPLTLYSPLIVQVIGWTGLISLLGILLYRWWQRNNLQAVSKKRLTGLAIIAGLAFLVYGVWGWIESDFSEVEIATAHTTGHTYHITLVGGCTIECFSSLRIYRCDDIDPSCLILHGENSFILDYNFYPGPPFNGNEVKQAQIDPGGHTVKLLDGQGNLLGEYALS